MKILLKSALIVDPSSLFNLQRKDIFIREGIIEKIAERIDPQDVDEGEECVIVEEKNMHVSPGWFDCGVQFGEPGYEEAETIQSGCAAAAAGGFTAVGLYSPKTQATDSGQKADFFISKTRDNAVGVYPIGSVTVGAQGKAMAETYDMMQAGAIAFSDNKDSVKDDLIAELCIEYNSSIGALTVTSPVNCSLLHAGQMNEGEINTRLGLKGIPDVVETVQVGRDIALAEYTSGKIHIQCVSAPDSLRMIKEAQKKGIDVTCHVTPHHLLLDEEILSEFDTRYKILPPLRSKAHIRAIKKAVKDGIVTCISSDHTPVDIEEKMCEFDKAVFGTIGLQTAFGASWMALSDTLDISRMVELLCVNPRKRFGLEVPSVVEGGRAELTLFDPETEWVFSKDDIVSLSKNSAFLGRRLKGIVIGIVNRGQLVIN